MTATPQPLPGAYFEITQKFFFDAAHTLKREIETEGSLRIHGHTYHAEVSLSGTPHPASGMVVDLGLVRRAIDELRPQLDHHLLDEVPGLGPAHGFALSVRSRRVLNHRGLWHSPASSAHDKPYPLPAGAWTACCCPTAPPTTFQTCWPKFRACTRW